MGKVKSAIITALFVAAVIVLALFAVISCGVPGSNGVKRYNSFISSIALSSEFTGDAYSLLYPEGVISAADYNFVVNDSESTAEEKEEYESTYVQRGSVYVDKDKLGDDATASKQGSKEQAFKDGVKKDAEILSSRYGKKGYSSYSVSIEDEFVIKVAVPTGFSYSEYKSYDSSSRSSVLSSLGTTLTYLSYSGDLSLRNGSAYSSSKSIIPIKYNFATFFKSVNYYAVGGVSAVKMVLTDDGLEKINSAISAYTTDDEDFTAYFFVGENSTGFTLSAALEDKTMYFQADESVAEDVSIVLSSVISGGTLENAYNADGLNTTSLVATTSSFGENATIYLGVAVLVILVAAIVASLIKYKKLGLVNTLVILIYALTIIIALLLLEIELSIAGLFTAVLGLALLLFTNFYVFEAIRKETELGRTLQAAVKTGYKKTLSAILDMHIILVVVSAVIAIVAIGEIAACALIFFFASLASYVLYWFTRFMWYVISSPVKDKFAFCGFKREVDDDED